MTRVPPIEWLPNPRARTMAASLVVDELFPAGIAQTARNFHRQIPGFRMSPLKSLSQLASKVGVGGIWVKDESARLDLRSFKILGGSFAIYRIIQRKLGPESQVLLINSEGNTDPDYFRRVAWEGAHSVPEAYRWSPAWKQTL